MFNKLESWLGIQDQNVQDSQERETSNDDNGDKTEVNNPSDNQQTSGDQVQLLPEAKSFSGYIYNFASSASKKLSKSVVGTVQNLKKSVEDGNMNRFFDKTILGDFQKEQEKFVQEKRAKQCTAAVPPWVGYNDEDSVQQQILSLSIDQRNFLRDPPAGVNFNFDFEQVYPVAMVMLEEDELLRKMRFHLVPKQLKEDVFWRNYFYRVSLIKQSAQLTALATQHAPERQEIGRDTSVNEQDKDAAQRKPLSTAFPAADTAEENIFANSPVPEFVSDAFPSCNLNEDLRKEMQRLVLAESPDWERELQEELQDLDVLAENQDDRWDQEIEMMLKEDS
ncbi:synapse-associated protein 1-like [Periophthalmus magnuspinnatus]|uniref:synapse-associated protein 1-like n=1 Tax=Periophthalmus magnuspinnatus TaxID=409849 RepID=UPI00145A38A7|nr:synapse-associated protein 1-like [Periophthalmus magnuspinnatus]